MTRPIGAAQFDPQEVPERSLVMGAPCDAALVSGKVRNRVEAELPTGEPLRHVRHSRGRRALQYRGRVKRRDAKRNNASANFQHEWS